MVAEPDPIETHQVRAYPHCQIELETIDPLAHEKRQVFDVPQPFTLSD